MLRPSELDWPARFKNDYACTLPNGELLLIGQSATSGRRSDDDPGDTGACVWDGALVLAQHLGRESAWKKLCAQLPCPAPALVLELGAGTALAGLAVHRCHRVPVLLTDLDSALPLTQRNAKAARQAAARAAKPHMPPAPLNVVALKWGDPASTAAALGGKRACVVVAADVCYRMLNVPLLISTLSAVLRPGGVAVLALDTSHCPEAVQECRERAEALFRVRQVSAEELSPGYNWPSVIVLEVWNVK